MSTTLMRLIRSPYSVITVGASVALYAFASGTVTRQGPCASRLLPRAEYTRLADSLRASVGQPPQQGGYPELVGSATTVYTDGGCATAVALSWDGELDGGVVVLGSSGKLLWGDVSYHGARDLVTAGANRILLTYTAGKGSGVYESRFVALCALRVDVWVECYEAIARTWQTVSGSSADEPNGTDLSMERNATVEVRGDTVIWRGRVKYRRHGDKATRDEALGTVRTLLPR